MKRCGSIMILGRALTSANRGGLTRSLRSDPHGRGLPLCPLLFAVFALIAPVALRSQTIKVFGSSGQISQGHDVYISPNPSPSKSVDWPMPEPTIYFSGANSCDTISLTINLSYVDPYTHYTTHNDISHTMAGNGTWRVDWGFTQTISEGGSGDIAYQINKGSVQHFYFAVGGLNGTETVVDSYDDILPDAPWFWPNIIDQESAGRQFNASFDPLVTGNPDGIGISQIEGTVHGAADCYYWNFECNLDVGTGILSQEKQTAYNQWAVYVSDAKGVAPPKSGSELAYCSFGWIASRSWADAEWITSYNGIGGVVINGVHVYPKGYYIEWGTAGWLINKDAPSVYSAHGSYVGDVCNKRPF